MTTKQPSFGHRAQSMQAIANNLLATANHLSKFAQEIAAEADRMAVAHERFAERRGGTNRKARSQCAPLLTSKLDQAPSRRASCSAS